MKHFCGFFFLVKDGWLHECHLSGEHLAPGRQYDALEPDHSPSERVTYRQNVTSRGLPQERESVSVLKFRDEYFFFFFFFLMMSISRFWGSEKLELYFKPSCHRYCRKPSKSPASEEVACVRLACQGVPNEADGFNNSLQLDYDFTMWRGLKATLITEHDKVLKQKCWVLCKLADNFVNSTWVSDFTLFIVSSVPSFNF